MGLIASLLGSLVTFVLGLVVGGVGVYVGAALVSGEDEFGTALWTALFGSLAWAVASALVSWIPLFGGLFGLVLGLLFYVGVISVQYDVAWTEAAAIALVAWIAVVLVGRVLSVVLGPFGVPSAPFVPVL